MTWGFTWDNVSTLLLTAALCQHRHFQTQARSKSLFRKHNLKKNFSSGCWEKCYQFEQKTWLKCMIFTDKPDFNCLKTLVSFCLNMNTNNLSFQKIPCAAGTSCSCASSRGEWCQPRQQDPHISGLWGCRSWPQQSCAWRGRSAVPWDC